MNCIGRVRDLVKMVRNRWHGRLDARLTAQQEITARMATRLEQLDRKLSTVISEVDELLSRRFGALESLARQSRLQEELQTPRSRLASFAGQPLAVYLTDEFRPAAQPTIGTSPHRVVVCSIPKAGTYLVHRLLELLGCVPSGMHVSSTVLTDYRFASRREAREEYERFLAPIPLDRSVELLLPGQFAVGHLECNDYARQALSGFKRVFVYRNLRDGLVSFLRFLTSTGRGGEATQSWKDLPAGPQQMLRFLDCAGESYFNMALPMIGWLDDGDVFHLEFETLYGDHGESQQQGLIDALCTFLEIPVDIVRDVRAIGGELFGAPTLTWSGGRATCEPYWSDEVEQRFIALGGLDANRRLGYHESRTHNAVVESRRAA